MFMWQMIAIFGLNIAYALVIPNEFGYMGYTFKLDEIKLVFGSILLISFYFLSFFIKDKFIFVTWNVLFIYLFASTVIHYQYTNNAKITQIFSVGLLLLILIPISRINIIFPEIKTKKNIERIMMLVCIFLFIPFLVLYYNHINIKNLFLIDVYETRYIFREISHPLTAYIQAPLARVLLPVLIVKSLENKKYGRMILSLMMIIYIYLTGALKSVFFGLVLLLALYKGNYQFKILAVLKGVSFFSIIGVILHKINGAVLLIDLPIRRIFFTPANLSNVFNKYYENNFTYFSHSPLGRLLGTYDSDISPSRFIGEQVIGSEGLSANVGVFTEGYISAGYFGLIIYAFIVALIFLFLKMTKIDSKYFGIVVVYIYYLNTSFLSTLLLTHGLFVFLIISYYLLRHNEEGVLISYT
ncbi:hypothetical protein AAK882_05250 [Carnobacteriaceae bacterium 52-44]